jgi:hypothetical protein
MAGEDPRVTAENERIRRQNIADQQAQIKRHGEKMDQAVSGADGNKGCFGMLIAMASFPLGAFIIERILA